MTSQPNVNVGAFSSNDVSVSSGTPGAATIAAVVAMTSPQTSSQNTGSITSSNEGNSSLGASGMSPSSSQFQRLKVEDALSYLDQVKLQFGNQPQVYNDFLDIMKEFKSQSIDTPGVISRVSNLFKGHPDLIVGFNTFLPPGFKIEVHGQNEINIQGPAQHSHTLQQIAMRHNAAAAAASGNQNSSNQRPSPSSSNPAVLSSQQKSHQPVEFNHAINYVNKIKNRFQGQPDVYKAFLEILHTYQKEQRLLKDGGIPSTTPLSETEVYGQVSKLFQNQEDLLSEFGQFLPDATSSHGLLGFAAPLALAVSKKQSGGKAHSRKSSQSSAGPPSKKSKTTTKDVLAEAGKHSNYTEVALFDKIRKVLHNQEVYDNFLRCLVLFNEEIVSRQELVQLVTPFLGKFHDLFSQFKCMLGFKEPSTAEISPEATPPPPQFPHKERVTEFAAEIDFNSLKRHGASYRALPKTYTQPKCSGRSFLCQEVLNDTWVSFPMWSEDTTFHGTRKTQYEEYIFRCEDERFELDVVLEANLATIKVLEAVLKKLSRMSPEDVGQFTLDDRLGGYSEVIHRKAIHRIYGDKATDIIEGLKKNPSIAIPVVLKRLKSKQEDWLDAQRQFNKIWREQLEKYHLKSLDHQGINFKATDTKIMRPKALVGEIEGLFDERQELLADGKSPPLGPHLSYQFSDDAVVFNDAISLVMYYMKRASSLTKEETGKIKGFLTYILSEFCYYPRVDLSSEDDLSIDSDSDLMEIDQEMKDAEVVNKPSNGRSTFCSLPEFPSSYRNLPYHTIFTNNTIYAFFRLFQFLCERLSKVYIQSLIAVEEQLNSNTVSLQDSVAVKLGLKKLCIGVEEYYPTFLNMAKNFMEGNIDSSSYEDTCREMFGVHAYPTFTVDRLVQNIVRQLHAMIAEENCLMVLEEYAKFVAELSDSVYPTSFNTVETSYQKKMEGILSEENCFKIIMTNKKVLKIELLESDECSDDNSGMETKKWHSYVEHFNKDEDENQEISSSIKSLVQERKIFLIRSHSDPLSLSSSSAVEDKGILQFDIHGDIEFKLDERTYRMIPLANSEDYMYRRNSLSRASQVNSYVFKQQKARFQEWYQQWCNKYLTLGMQKSCDEWFLGVNNSGHSHTEQWKEEYNGHKRTVYKTKYQ